jgi:hypothetical protein
MPAVLWPIDQGKTVATVGTLQWSPVTPLGWQGFGAAAAGHEVAD